MRLQPWMTPCCLPQIVLFFFFILNLKERSLKQSIFFILYIRYSFYLNSKMNPMSKYKNSAHFLGQATSPIHLIITVFYTHTCMPSPPLVQGPLSKTNLIFSHLADRGRCGPGEVGTSTLRMLLQIQLPLGPSPKHFPALPHPLHVFPLHPRFLVSSGVLESLHQGPSPTCICHPTLDFHRASCQLTWRHSAHATRDFSKWLAFDKPQLYFVNHFFSPIFQSLVYFKRKLNLFLVRLQLQ